MIKTALIVAAVLVLGVLAFATTKPDTFTVQRSATIKAPPEKIHAVLNDFKRWPEWSPWEKLDPSMKRTLGGAASGQGATYAWEGNSKVGAGRMEILQTVPAAKVSMKLDFVRPFEGHNTADFTLAPKAGGTEVTWAMAGPTPFISKLMQVFVNMDTMIGTDFEEGLANLKTLAEK